MYDQKIFDTIVLHLRTQNAKSMMADGDSGEKICAYRGEEGRKCAVGCIITDEEYYPDMEGKTIGLLAKSFFKGSLNKKIEDNFALLIKLQNIHDNVDVGDWESHFYLSAYDLGLTYTPKA